MANRKKYFADYYKKNKKEMDKRATKWYEDHKNDPVFMEKKKLWNKNAKIKF